jgi:hypothetical protein
MYPQLFPPSSTDHGNNTDVHFSSSGRKSAAHLVPEVIDEVSELVRWVDIQPIQSRLVRAVRRDISAAKEIHLDSRTTLRNISIATVEYQQLECRIKFILMTLLIPTDNK